MRHLLLLLLLACSVQAQVIWGTFQAASAGAAGAPGVVPGPAAGDQAKFLRADATWQTITPTSLGLVIGTNVQAYDADLTTWATVTPSSNGQSLVAAADYAAMRGLLDLEAGTDFPALATYNGLVTRVGADETRLAVEVFARLAADAAAIFALPPNAWVDQYEDQTGVDDTASTGEYYDATNDLYSNVTPSTSDNSADKTYSASSTNFGSSAAAFDDNYTAGTNGWGASSGVAGGDWLKIDYGDGNAVANVEAKILWWNSDIGRTNQATLEGSNDDSNWTTIATLATNYDNVKTTYSLVNATAYRYYRLRGTGSNNGHMIVCEVELYATTTAAATIIGEAKTTTAAPTAGKLIVLASLGGGAINTALSATLSRDGGTTDCAVTLASAGAYDGTYTVYEGECTFTGASGTSLRYELTTDANQTVNVKAVSWMGR